MTSHVHPGRVAEGRIGVFGDGCAGVSPVNGVGVALAMDFVLPTVPLKNVPNGRDADSLCSHLDAESRGAGQRRFGFLLARPPAGGSGEIAEGVVDCGGRAVGLAGSAGLVAGGSADGVGAATPICAPALVVVCAWCEREWKVEQNVTKETKKGQVSHGVCARHLAVLRAELEGMR